VLDDEFGLLSENAEEAGLAWAGPPMVTRRTVDVGGRDVSTLAWRGEPAGAVFLHGGAQNAHTWDTVALALGRPMLAVDLPGHGRSGWRPDGDYGVEGMADDVVEVVRQLAPEATMLVGIGLGAPVALLATRQLSGGIKGLVMIDSAPGARPTGAAVRDTAAGTNVAAFTAQHAFASFDEMLDRAVRFNPGRSERSLRRGILHNAHERADGTWSWRWDPSQRHGRDFAFDATAEALTLFAGSVLLVRGGRSDIVTDETVSAFRARHANTELVTIDDAGHAVQGDRPVELALALDSFWGR
jgi:pimeloyl-ACP methyl ester carboxylesterase